MKKVLSLILCGILLATAVASCAPKADRLDPAITVASSEAQTYADWLDGRLEVIPDNVVLGVGSDSAYGVDMTDFEDEGYIIRQFEDEVLIFGKTADGLDRAVRKYEKAAKVGNTGDIDTVYLEGKRIKKLTIADNDISEYTIVYPADEANENMLFAIDELKRLVEIACGFTLPVKENSAEGKVIEFAFSDDESLNDDGYKYSVTDGNLKIEGAEARGCMNGVWRFLQNELGWTGLIHGDSYLTPSEHVNVPEGTAKTETPAFEFLALYYLARDSYKNEKASPTAAQNSYGTITHACHGIQNNRFCEEDYLARQICYTDEDRYQECLENVQIYIEKQMASGKRVGYELKEIDIAQGDNNVYCSCKECQKVFREEMGHAGAVVRFANRLSEELNETYPGIVYKIFAYSGTNVPPKITVPNEFVYVTFCYDMNCTNHLVDGTECGNNQVPFNQRNNADYAEWFEGWCALTDNVYIWLYYLDTNLQQYTVLHTIYDDYRYFHEQGIKGIFLEAEAYGLGIRRIEFELIAELNWNIDMTEEEFEAVLCSLLEKDYGDGWEYIRDYIHIWKRSQDLARCWHCWSWDVVGSYQNRYNTDYYAESFDTGVELFENALGLVNSRIQEERLENLSCHMYYEGCYSSYYNEWLEGDEERIAVLSERYDLLISRLKKNGYDPKAILTLISQPAIKENLHEAAWHDWVDWFDDITGQPLPKDAPVIETEAEAA